MILQLPDIEIDDALPIKEQIRTIKEILTDMSEKLTFMLNEIDTDNLSENLLKQIGGGDNNTTQSPTINMGIFLKKADAEDTYLSKTDAESTYMTITTANSSFVGVLTYNSTIQAISAMYNNLNSRVTALEQRSST